MTSWKRRVSQYRCRERVFCLREKNTELIREANLKEIESLMERILSLAATCGLNSDDLLEMFRYFMKGE